MERAMNHKIKLDDYEERIENEILNFTSLSEEEKSKIENIIDRENEKVHKFVTDQLIDKRSILNG